MNTVQCTAVSTVIVTLSLTHLLEYGIWIVYLYFRKERSDHNHLYTVAAVLNVFLGVAAFSLELGDARFAAHVAYDVFKMCLVWHIWAAAHVLLSSLGRTGQALAIVVQTLFTIGQFAAILAYGIESQQSTRFPFATGQTARLSFNAVMLANELFITVVIALGFIRGMSEGNGSSDKRIFFPMLVACLMIAIDAIQLERELAGDSDPGWLIARAGSGIALLVLQFSIVLGLIVTTYCLHYG